MSVKQMKRLVIIGARGFGREVFSLAQRCIDAGAPLDIAGFLDDKHDALAGLVGYPPILGPVETYAIRPEDRFVCALGDVRFRQKYVQLALARGGIFTSLVDPTATICSNVQLGNGILVFNNVLLSSDVAIGAFTTVFSYALLGHDAQVGNFCHLGPYAFLGGSACVEDNVTLHVGSRVMPHRRVCCGAIVGVNSVVMQSVRQETTVFGNPAQPLFTPAPATGLRV
jgi:sugar O-acyltransferase (sialic acid O-acetyltransferase NeuD family)